MGNVRMAFVASAFASPLPNRWVIDDVTLSPGSASALNTKVLRDQYSGESLQVVVDSGGMTARLALASAGSRRVRDVIVPQTSADTMRDAAHGSHYAGSILAPFANRVANGTAPCTNQPSCSPRGDQPLHETWPTRHILLGRYVHILWQDAPSATQHMLSSAYARPIPQPECCNSAPFQF